MEVQPHMNAPEAYEQFLVPNVFRPWAEAVISRADGMQGHRILDVATGTGICARLAAAEAGPAGQVTGIDIDPLALEVAARAVVDETAAPIKWIEANATNVPLLSGSVETAFCLEGLQFFPDRIAALSEIHRVLVAGRRLFASCWAALTENPGYQAISEALRRFVSEEAARLPPFGLSDADELARVARAAGFSTVAVEHHEIFLFAPSARDFVDWIAAGGPTMRHSIAQLEPGRREEFLQFIEDYLAPYAEPAGLRLPSARNILTATR
jgi:SAM-dependent methyltransferase